MERELAVVCASGGMDSCVTAVIAGQRYSTAFLHVKYGQRTQAREEAAFNALADYFRAQRRLVCTLEHLGRIGGSSLTDTRLDVPQADLASEEIPNTYVPFRNAHILASAVSWAEVIGATKIFFGAMEEDSSGYPDCRELFYQSFNRVIEAGTRPETNIEIVTPIIHLKKSDIVKKGMKLDAPFQLTWSCYVNDDLACGACDSCALRLKAFNEAGFADPIAYATGR